MFRSIRARIRNWKKSRWKTQNEHVIHTLKRFDKRVEKFPLELQKARKLGYLISNKKWLTESQYRKWHQYLLQSKGIDKKEENESRLTFM